MTRLRRVMRRMMRCRGCLRMPKWGMPWHPRCVAKPSPAPANNSSERTWYTVPELVDVLGVGVGRIHRLLEDKHLLAARIDGVLKVPSDFIAEGEPLSELRGTLIVLADAGFDDDEAMAWLTEP